MIAPMGQGEVVARHEVMCRFVKVNAERILYERDYRHHPNVGR